MLKRTQSMRLSLSPVLAGPATDRETEPEKEPWSQRIFWIGPKSKLIHPLSAFTRAWLCVTCMLLAYTAIVTPPTIAFHWHDDEVMLLKTCARRP